MMSHSSYTQLDDGKLDNVSTVSGSINNDSTLQADTMSTDIELEDAAEGSMDFHEITQSILDMEETQQTSSNSKLSSKQIPSSPPPSYEYVLAETRLEEAEAEAAASAEQHRQASEMTLEEKIPAKGIEIIHKSHKELYRAMAKQWGITCKMSDHCRCLDCQSMYFECEYDQNEQEKTDGGLGAGTPMFISDVMHASTCTLL